MMNGIRWRGGCWAFVSKTGVAVRALIAVSLCLCSDRLMKHSYRLLI